MIKIVKKCNKCNKIVPSESKFCLYCASPIITRKKLRIEAILEDLKTKKPTENLLFKLTDEFRKNWREIRKNNLLTFYIIDVIREVRVPINPNYMVHRAGGDSRSGGVFEDVFGQLLERYLQADSDFWSDAKVFLLKIVINKSISIPNEPKKRSADIIISLKSNEKPIIILELKVRFTQRSLIKTYDEMEEMYKRLSPNLQFFFVIMNTSRQKAKTYKKASPNCRIICYDFKLDKDSIIKQIQPKIIDPIEIIFEDIKKIIKEEIVV